MSKRSVGRLYRLAAVLCLIAGVFDLLVGNTALGVALLALTLICVISAWRKRVPRVRTGDGSGEA